MAKSKEPIKVLKFGGTSVGSTEIIKKLPILLKREMGNSQLVVVVSAFSGVTNQLNELIDIALVDFSEAKKYVIGLREKHQKMYAELTNEADSSYICLLYTSPSPRD